MKKNGVTMTHAVESSDRERCTFTTSNCECKLSRGSFGQVLSTTHVLLKSQSPSEYADMYTHHKFVLPPSYSEYDKSSINLYPHFHHQINIMFQYHVLVSFKYTTTFIYFLNGYISLSLYYCRK